MSAVLGPGVDEPVCPRCCSRRCASIPARMAYRAAFKAWPRDATDADYDAIAALVDAIPEDCEPASPWKLVERVEALTEENARLRAALSAPPPDAEIERLVDAYGRVMWSNGYGAGGGRPSDLADMHARAARSALLAAISRRVPDDLAGLLTDACALAATVAAADADDAITAIKVYADDAPGFDYGGGRALYLRDAAGQLRDRIVGALARANLAPPAPAEES